MYNTDTKQRWLDMKNAETITSPNYYANKFSNTEPYENMYGKDLCNFTVSEIMDMYKSMNIYSPSTVYTTNKIYADYANWCIAEGLVNDSQNHFLEITREMTLECVNKSAMNYKIISSEQITEWCNAAINYADKFLLLGLFEGLKGNKFVDFTDTKISDLNGNEIHLPSGRVLECSDKLIMYAEESHNETVYTYYNSGRQAPLATTEEIMKPVAIAKSFKSFNKWKRLFTRYDEISNYMGFRGIFSMNDIRISGMIDYINRNASKEKITAEEYIKIHKTEIEYRYIKTYKFYETYKDYLV